MLKSRAVNRNLNLLASSLLAIAVLLSSFTRPVDASDTKDGDFQHSESDGPPRLHLSDSEAAAIGNKVWRNECGGRIDGLTSWNVGEDFPSLGIGHFIWYPKDAHDKFEESFPRLIEFL